MREYDKILKEFIDFDIYINRKTTNIFGIFIILIKQDAGVKWVNLENNDTYQVNILYCNEQFLDGGHIFQGKCDEETQMVKYEMQKIFYDNTTMVQNK